MTSSMTGGKGPLSGTKLSGGYKQGQMQQFTPEQMDLFKQMFSQVGPESYTSRLAGGDQSLFSEMEAPALRQFSELQGGMASKYSGMGTGARRSSGFANEMNQAGSNFAQDLQSKRQSLQRQAIQDLMGMSESLLNQRPYENYRYKNEKKKKPWLSTGLGIGGAIIGGALGGPAGATAGYGIGNATGSSFE